MSTSRDSSPGRSRRSSLEGTSWQGSVTTDPDFTDYEVDQYLVESRNKPKKKAQTPLGEFFEKLDNISVTSGPLTDEEYAAEKRNIKLMGFSGAPEYKKDMSPEELRQTNIEEYNEIKRTFTKAYEKALKEEEEFHQVRRYLEQQKNAKDPINNRWKERFADMGYEVPDNVTFDEILDNNPQFLAVLLQNDAFDDELQVYFDKKKERENPASDYNINLQRELRLFSEFSRAEEESQLLQRSDETMAQKMYGKRNRSKYVPLSMDLASRAKRFEEWKKLHPRPITKRFYDDPFQITPPNNIVHDPLSATYEVGTDTPEYLLQYQKRQYEKSGAKNIPDLDFSNPKVRQLFYATAELNNIPPEVRNDPRYKEEYDELERASAALDTMLWDAAQQLNAKLRAIEEATTTDLFGNLVVKPGATLPNFDDIDRSVFTQEEFERRKKEGYTLDNILTEKDKQLLSHLVAHPFGQPSEGEDVIPLELSTPENLKYYSESLDNVQQNIASQHIHRHIAKPNFDLTKLNPNSIDELKAAGIDDPVLERVANDKNFQFTPFDHLLDPDLNLITAKDDISLEDEAHFYDSLIYKVNELRAELDPDRWGANAKPDAGEEPRYYFPNGSEKPVLIPPKRFWDEAYVQESILGLPLEPTHPITVYRLAIGDTEEAKRNPWLREDESEEEVIEQLKKKEEEKAKKPKYGPGQPLEATDDESFEELIRILQKQKLEMLELSRVQNFNELQAQASADDVRQKLVDPASWHEKVKLMRQAPLKPSNSLQEDPIQFNTATDIEKAKTAMREVQRRLEAILDPDVDAREFVADLNNIKPLDTTETLEEIIHEMQKESIMAGTLEFKYYSLAQRPDGTLDEKKLDELMRKHKFVEEDPLAIAARKITGLAPNEIELPKMTKNTIADTFAKLEKLLDAPNPTVDHHDELKKIMDEQDTTRRSVLEKMVKAKLSLHPRDKAIAEHALQQYKKKYENDGVVTGFLGVEGLAQILDSTNMFAGTKDSHVQTVQQKLLDEERQKEEALRKSATPFDYTEVTRDALSVLDSVTHNNKQYYNDDDGSIFPTSSKKTSKNKRLPLDFVDHDYDFTRRNTRGNRRTYYDDENTTKFTPPPKDQQDDLFSWMNHSKTNDNNNNYNNNNKQNTKQQNNRNNRHQDSSDDETFVYTPKRR